MLRNTQEDRRRRRRMREEWSVMLERHHRLVTLLATGNICFSVDQSAAGAVCYCLLHRKGIF